MNIEIKRINGEVIICGEYESIGSCMQEHLDKSFRGADLVGADLSRANLNGADLQGAKLREADLSGADLRRANLIDANLFCANLSGADLNGAILRRADLFYADFYCTDLINADLRGARYLWPPALLTAKWKEVSDELCIDLMRYDAANHPVPTQFLAWARGGPCPYGDGRFVRSANFYEKCELVKEDFLERPVKSAYELMMRLFAEKCKGKEAKNE